MYQAKLSTDISYVSAAMMTRIDVVMTSRANAVQHAASRNSFIVVRSHSSARSAFHGASRGTYARTTTVSSARLRWVLSMLQY